ncbi:hydrolytic ATP binding site of dynein motor region D1-domain-containing protein [Phakopsora pachyrhizi]|uniref:Hydrolytic ATP binding site of dynein motor region D1-domain-containing protein n=1 Tax=Phakopsora pachyrhizi TaxID=170000 RepID=A0AAV0ANL0_PHAPC|nr:hydrolytic ATP binding site of dynein motor region D1-domain-containing protein [Phakopsora pachyrhizi]
MFAGLLALIIDQDLTRKENMCSREGREIPFPTPIILKNSQKINDRLSKVESQIKLVVLVAQSGISLKGPLQIVLKALDVLALVRDVIRLLIKDNSVSRFEWSYHMQFYLEVSVANPIESLSIHMANAVFPYGFKYLGTFDFQATGRIFVGLFQVGAWGYFDGANRLEERILSAVSHLIQSIKLGLGAISFDQSAEVEIVGNMLWINTNTGIVITMNPGYAGRSNLPDNLKLFRSMAMTCPIGGAIIASVDQREQCILIQSVTETIVSKLVAEHLKEHIHHIVSELHLVVGNIQNIQHRLMMVGPLATGKTGAWRALLGALGRLAISKDFVYDSLNPTTPEWNFGLFTNIIRKIIDNVGDEVSKQHWIIFMAMLIHNGVLDDSKLLTLPIGKQLGLPNNVQIIFEVESLNIPPLPLSVSVE